MEQKQLNFNAPLLSVRRLLSSSKSSKAYVQTTTNSKPAKTGKNQINRHDSLHVQTKTKEELAEVIKPAAVPFQWEKTPGRAKDENTEPVKNPTTPPRLPPGRLSGVQNRLSGIGSRNSDEFICDRKSDAAQYREHAALLENLANGIIGTDDSGTDSNDEDGDMYSEAHNDSLTLRNSPRSGFLPDPKTRDFLMSRFLPAAKALVLEIPQYVSRKQNSVSGELSARPAKNFYSGELKPLRDQFGFNSILNYNKHLVSNNDYDDDDNDNDGFKDNAGKKTRKSCGFFPKLCVKNALFLMNPLPGLKSRESSPARKSRESSPARKSRESLPVLKSRPPMNPAGNVRRMARTSHSGPLPQTRDKHTPDPVYERSSQFVRKPRNLLESKNKLTPSRHSHESPNIIDSLMTKLPLGSRPSKGGGRISPYRNETPRSPFHDGARFQGLPKNLDQNYTSLIKTCDNFLAVSFQKNSKGVDPVGPVSEKTLYIDTNVKLDQKLYHTVEMKDVEVEDPKKDSFELKDVDVEDRKTDSLESSLPPPLPKSPSESWLWKTLPSISFRNPFSATMTRKHGQNSPKRVGAKWETIVKTSNVRHDHVRYSEELVPHHSPHSKT